MGFLFSSTDADTIDFAYTLQTADRRFKSLDFSSFLGGYIVDSAQKNCGMKLVGDFHSHTDYKGESFCALSEFDISGLRKQYPGSINIVLNLVGKEDEFVSIDLRGYYYDLEQKKN